jgi:4-hydroxy-4-methyl-2-oxoglutarate aldolase
MTTIAEALETLRALPAATVYEAAGKVGDMAPHIRAMVPGLRMAGPAFTLRTMPGDNLSVFRAIDEAPRGSVLVIDGGGSDRVTIWGGTSTVAAQAKGLAGVVTNAAVRDMDEILESRFPVYAPGTSVRGTAKSHPGWLDIPISVGDVIVRPGDIVLGDTDGVVVVAADQAVAVAAKAVAMRQVELEREDRLRRGESIRDVIGR